MIPDENAWKRCSTCKKPIGFGEAWYACSVSTCNRKRTGLFFCSVECFQAHVPEMRHRDAWAEPQKAPTRERWLEEQREEREEREAAARRDETAKTDPTEGRKMSELPQDVLVVVSKLKTYIRARSGMNTSDTVTGVLSDHVRRLCDEAIRNAARDGRKTVMDRDFREPT